MDESDGLENRYASHFCHQRLGPMKEATSFGVAFLVSGVVRLSERRTEFFCWSPSMNQRVYGYLVRPVQE